MSDNIHAILKLYWGYDTFRSLQEDIIQSVLKGNDTLALLPTGGGKSVCFQVPALAKQGICIVVSPLIALMKDQVANLNAKGIKAVAIYSGLNYREADALLDNCVYGNIKFLYVSPERLLTDDFRARVVKMNVNLIAVDEAHCISQWGYDFRPPYLRIAELRALLPKVPVLALTATATPAVVDDIQEKLNFSKKNVFVKSFVRTNLSYVVRFTDNKRKTLLDILKKVPGTSVVYVRNRARTKQFADFLQANHVSADFYHAGLSVAERSVKQDRWINNKTRVICCTNAFGMGIDKPEVRTVVHMDPPETLEAYFQEAGRAGRDGKKAYAAWLYDKSDIEALQGKIENGFPDVKFIVNVYDALGKYCNLAFNSGINASYTFDISAFVMQYKLDMLLTLASLRILEQNSIVQFQESGDLQSRVKVSCSKDVLYRFISNHKQLEPLVKLILRTSEGIFLDYVSVQESLLAKHLNQTASEVTEQLNQLQNLGVFSYKAATDSGKVIWLQNRVEPHRLVLDARLIEHRRQLYISKVQSVKSYLEENNICRTKLLVHYFGETNATECGICDVCVARTKTGLSQQEFQQTVCIIRQVLQNKPMPLRNLLDNVNAKQEVVINTLEFLEEAGNIESGSDGLLIWKS